MRWDRRYREIGMLMEGWELWLERCYIFASCMLNVMKIFVSYCNIVAWGFHWRKWDIILRTCGDWWLRMGYDYTAQLTDKDRMKDKVQKRWSATLDLDSYRIA